ncbi:unnamed protein product [marine sediment metagenome]|uniref:Uncharacterized protein n=1 Tax=marine sediment metagenome TaxID=412755 RepID=X1L2G4_9ZZZZ
MKEKEITERQLKNAIDWFVVMYTWEATAKSIRKTGRMKQRLEDYVLGKIKLKR